MPRFKKIIVRLSVFLLLFLLVATALSRTIYRLLLPQVSEVSVSGSGGLDNTLTFRSVAGPPVGGSVSEGAENGESAADTSPADLKYAVDLSLTFSEIQLICAQGTETTAVAEMVYGPVGIPVDIWISGYDYDSASDRYILHLFIRCKEEEIKTGSVIRITASQTAYVSPYYVPLNSVYTELVSGMPQYYIYALVDRQTMWGKATFVQKRIVTLGGSDYQCAQVTFEGEAPKRAACYPSRPLQDGDVVKVLKES